jgi:GNAT superfamily N-acetyltransferase
MPGYDNVNDVEFRAEGYTAAHAGPPWSNLRTATEELPDHPDRTPPLGRELEPRSRGIFVVVYVNGQPAASGGYRLYPGDVTGDTVEFVRLYVRPTARRTGLGRALLAELEDRAADDDYRLAVLPIGADQPAAQAMFEFLGYHRLPGQPDPWGRLHYGKDLPA